MNMEFQSEVLAVRQETHDVRTFRFSVPRDFTFKPGQFIMLFLDVDGKEDSRAFSISSSPAQKGYIETTKKIGDSGYSKKLSTMTEGNRVKIRGPFGLFILEENEKNIMLLAGGIGVTPFRSMVHYVADKKLPNKITLFYSAKTPEDIAFKKEFEELVKRNRNIKIVYTVTRPEESKQKWSGVVGRIDESMIKQHADTNGLYYVAGPPAMVDAMVAMVKSMGIPQNRIKIERFVGY